MTSMTFRKCEKSAKKPGLWPGKGGITYREYKLASRGRPVGKKGPAGSRKQGGAGPR